MPGLRNASGLNIPIIEAEGGTAADNFTQARINMLLAHTYSSQTGNYIAVASDLNKFIRFSGAGPYTLDLTLAATLGSQWAVNVRNDTSANLLINPTGGELINGVGGVSIAAGQSVTIYCTGTAFFTTGQLSAVDGANQELSNLTPTAINESLNPDTDGLYDLGTASLTWRDTYTQTLLSPNNIGDTIIMGVWDTGSLTYVPIVSGQVGNPAIATIASFVEGTTQAPGTNTDQLATCAFVQAAVGGGGFVTSVSGTAGRITSSGGATPTIDIDATYVGQASITTLGTVTTGTWNGTVIDLAHGGTNANLTAANGGIVYTDADSMEILAPTATARQMLQSGASTAPAWSTATWPDTTTANRILYSSSANVVGEITSAASSVLVTDGSSVPSFSTALPNGVTATTQAPGTNDTTVATTAFVAAAVTAGSGSLVKIAQVVASSSATVDFSNNLSATYNNYIVVFNNMIPQTGNTALYAFFGTGAGPTWQATNYAGVVMSSVNAAGFASSAWSSVRIELSLANWNTTSANRGSGRINIFNVNSSSNWKQIDSTLIYDTSSATNAFVLSAGRWQGATVLTSFRLQQSSGNINDGTFTLYGVVP